MYKSEKLHLRIRPVSVPHNAGIETAQERYVREVSALAKAYVKELLSKRWPS